MKFITPYFKRKENPIGVYRIWFDEKWFYIGSSGKLKTRFTRWRTAVNNPKFLKNKNIGTILPGISCVRFEIIITQGSILNLKHIETKEILNNWDNPFLLNLCPNADTPKGIRPYFGKKPSEPRKLKGIPDYMKPQKVAMFNNNNEILKIFESKSSLVKYCNYKHNIINAILSGKRGQPRKFKLKIVSNENIIIEPPVYIKPPQVHYQPNTRKPVNQIDENGVIIATHKSYRDAANNIGCSANYIHNLLKGKTRGKRAKGYYFKYA